MSTQKELDICYMNCAIAHSKLSKAARRKVGAVLVTETGVLVGGVNGLPKEFGNQCEHKDYNLDNLEYSEDYPYMDNDGMDYRLVTKEEVIHAELNCLLKCAKEGIDTRNSTVHITLSPCMQCASMLLQAGVKRIVYLEEYRDESSIDKLNEIGFNIEKFMFNESEM